ncbi:MAG: hypothetical protein ACM37W_17455 [Actinomycetota bacterium]
MENFLQSLSRIALLTALSGCAGYGLAFILSGQTVTPIIQPIQQQLQQQPPQPTPIPYGMEFNLNTPLGSYSQLGVKPR